MNLILLSYNVWFNKATDKLGQILNFHHPDIICLQEIETNENNFKKVEEHGYKLADYSNSFIKFGRIFGLATFYNPKTIIFNDSKTIFLQKSIYEVLLTLLRIFRGGNKPRTVLKTHFQCIAAKKKLIVFNNHLSMHGTNSIRIKQLENVLRDAATYKTPIIVSGDLNYPYGRKRFESLMQKYHFFEATNRIVYTYEMVFLRFFVFRAKNDYVLYRNLQSGQSEKISVQFSDHSPIITKFAF